MSLLDEANGEFEAGVEADVKRLTDAGMDGVTARRMVELQRAMPPLPADPLRALSIKKLRQALAAEDTHELGRMVAQLEADLAAWEPAYEARHAAMMDNIRDILAAAPKKGGT